MVFWKELYWLISPIPSKNISDQIFFFAKFFFMHKVWCIGSIGDFAAQRRLGLHITIHSLCHNVYISIFYHPAPANKMIILCIEANAPKMIFFQVPSTGLPITSNIWITNYFEHRNCKCWTKTMKRGFLTWVYELWNGERISLGLSIYYRSMSPWYIEVIHWSGWSLTVAGLSP